MKREVGRPRLTWEKCVSADLKVLGEDGRNWEVSCQIRCAWRKRWWDLTHPWGSVRWGVRCEGRKKQAIQKHAERHAVPFSGWAGGDLPMLRWWEPPPAPTRVLLDPTASPLPMSHRCGVGCWVLGLVYRVQLVSPLFLHAVASSLSFCID
jgi:hypothetical protein